MSSNDTQIGELESQRASKNLIFESAAAELEIGASDHEAEVARIAAGVAWTAAESNVQSLTAS